MPEVCLGTVGKGGEEEFSLDLTDAVHINYFQSEYIS